VQLLVSELRLLIDVNIFFNNLTHFIPPALLPVSSPAVYLYYYQNLSPLCTFTPSLYRATHPSL